MVRIKRAEDALREKEKEQQKLISELPGGPCRDQDLERVHTICATCKKIRDE